MPIPPFKQLMSSVSGAARKIVFSACCRARVQLPARTDSISFQVTWPEVIIFWIRNNRGATGESLVLASSSTIHSSPGNCSRNGGPPDTRECRLRVPDKPEGLHAHVQPNGPRTERKAKTVVSGWVIIWRLPRGK